MPARKPNFLIIGAQKCGTSWLHKHLSAHPDVFLPVGKDLEFFSYVPYPQPGDIDAYLEHFQEAGPAQAVGEATASYFWSHSTSPWCEMPEGFQTNIPKAVKHYLGAELKLIVVLRHPARRAISAYLHYLNEGELAPTATFEESMKYVGTIDMGFYARHLAAWLEVFDLSQIKVLTLENDIRERPAFTLSQLCEFLGVRKYLGKYPGEISTLEQVVYPGIAKHNNRRGVFADIGRLRPQPRLENPPSQDEYVQILSPGQWQELESIYQADVAQLDSLLGTHLLQDWGFLQ